MNPFKRIKNWFKIKNEIRWLRRENKFLEKKNIRLERDASRLSDKLAVIYNITDKAKEIKIVQRMAFYEANVRYPIEHPERVKQMAATLNKISKIIAGSFDCMPGWRMIEKMFQRDD